MCAMSSRLLPAIDAHRRVAWRDFKQPGACCAEQRLGTLMIRKFLASLRGAASDRKGVTAAEYAILAVGIVIVVGGAVLAFRGQLNTAFTSIGNQITSSQTSLQR